MDLFLGGETLLILPDRTGAGEEMSPLRELHNVGIFYGEFPVGTQFVAQNVKEPQFIGAPDRQVVARRMEGQSEQGLIVLRL